MAVEMLRKERHYWNIFVLNSRLLSFYKSVTPTKITSLSGKWNGRDQCFSVIDLVLVLE